MITQAELASERRFLMEPRKEVLKKKVSQDRKNERKNRFQIVKLEERIAPNCSYHTNPQGKGVGHYTRGCGGR
jgi:hypothetical protein